MYKMYLRARILKATPLGFLLVGVLLCCTIPSLLQAWPKGPVKLPSFGKSKSNKKSPEEGQQGPGEEVKQEEKKKDGSGGGGGGSFDAQKLANQLSNNQGQAPTSSPYSQPAVPSGGAPSHTESPAPASLYAQPTEKGSRQGIMSKLRTSLTGKSPQAEGASSGAKPEQKSLLSRLEESAALNREKTLKEIISGLGTGKSFTELMSGSGDAKSRTEMMSENADRALATLRKTGGGETPQMQKQWDTLVSMKKNDEKFLNDLAKDTPTNRAVTLKSKMSSNEKNITAREKALKADQEALKKLKEDPKDIKKKEELEAQIDLHKRELDRLHLDQRKNAALLELVQGKVYLGKIPFGKEVSVAMKPDFLITRQLQKEAKNAQQQRKLISRERVLQKERPVITQEELIRTNETLLHLQDRAEGKIRLPDGTTKNNKIDPQEKARIEALIDELTAVRNEAVARAQAVNNGRVPTAKESTALTQQMRGKNLAETQASLTSKQTKREELAKDPESNKEALKALDKEIKKLGAQEKLQKKLVMGGVDGVQKELAMRSKNLKKTTENYLNLQSGDTWSEKKRNGVITVVAGLGLVGTLTGIVMALNPLDTPSAGGGSGGVFDGQVTAPGLTDATAALGNAAIKNSAGSVVSGNFSNAQLAPTTGAAAPSGSTAVAPLSPEEIVQKKVADLSSTQAFGRALTPGEQQEVRVLLTQLQEEKSALKKLKETKSSAEAKGQEFSQPELLRLKGHEQTIAQLTTDFFLKELSIRYGKDDGSLVSGYDYRATVAQLSSLQALAAQDISKIIAKIDLLTKAMQDPRYLSDTQKQKEIADGIAKLKTQQQVAEGKKHNIDQEIEYLNLQRKRLAQEITADDVTKTVRALPSFGRDTREPYDSSKTRRLSTTTTTNTITNQATESSSSSSTNNDGSSGQISYAVLGRR